MRNEKWLDGIELPDWDSNENGSPDMEFVLHDILGRYNDAADQMERPWNKRAFKSGYRLDLTTGLEGNDATVRMLDDKGSHVGAIYIGYFSPADSGFALFPEYVTTPDEVNIIEGAALADRMRAIQDFDLAAKRQENRRDYGHPAVQYLHRMHKQFLEQSDILPGIMDRQNFLAPLADDDYSDEFTRAAIFLRRKYVNGTDIDYVGMGVKIVGAFNRFNEVNHRRNGPLHIDIANRNPEVAEESDFSQTDRFIAPYMFDEFVEQAQHVIELDNRTDLGAKFDTHGLCLRVGPQSHS